MSAFRHAWARAKVLAVGTISDAADKMCISREALSKVLNGRTPPGAAIRDSLAWYLDVPQDELFEGGPGPTLSSLAKRIEALEGER